ncbi:GWT1-domain-containing protein [Cytidiella melzeri]|nr:GWT1-domain-containing protein [Cytidiella melzeri]
MEDYKTSKEAFVSGMTGSSIGHINMVSLVALASIALHSTLRTRLPPNRTINLPVEFLLLVVPLLLSVTLFANSPALLLIVIMIPTGVLFLLPPRESGTPLPSNLGHSRPTSPTPDRVNDNNANEGSPGAVATVPPLPALTTYRSHMLLLTCLCILAVDFPVFPRSLAKCETFGVSIMDLGVGSFVFSQGVVSAIPLIKDPQYLKAPMLPKLLSTARKCLPVLILGVLRTLSVKGTNYPEHQTEYGVHWNFFLTLGLIPLLQVFVHPLVVYLPISLLGILLAISHQIALASGGLMDYVMHAPRHGVISANKEGLISMTGYFSIHLIGLSTGTIVLPPSPGFFRRLQHELQNNQGPASVVNEPNSESESDDDTPSRRRPRIRFRRENDKTATELCSYAVVWWVVLGIALAVNVGGGVSRRVVNLPYVVWVSAFNTTFILGYLLLDLVFFPSPLSKSIYSPTSKLKVQPDPAVLSSGRRNTRGQDDTTTSAVLLDAINRNGLVFFLLGNILTGFVNLALPTMYMSDWWAMVVLGTYGFVISAAAWFTKDKKLWRI